MTSKQFHEWYTLVRFDATPSNITAVAQTRNAAEAIRLALEWSEGFPRDTICVFDPSNVPVSQIELARAAEVESRPPVSSIAFALSGGTSSPSTNSRLASQKQ